MPSWNWLEAHLPMTEETTKNFLRRGVGRSELQPGKRRSEGNSLEGEGEAAAAGGSSSAAALGGWTGLGRHRRCRSAGQVFDASGWRSAAAAVYSVRGRRRKARGGGGRCMHLGSGWQQPLRSPRLSRSVTMTCGSRIRVGPGGEAFLAIRR